MGVVGIIGLAISAFGAVQQHQAGKKADKRAGQAAALQAKADKLAMRREKLENTQRRRDLSREIIRKRARSIAITKAQGMGSAGEGATGSIVTQGSSASGFLGASTKIAELGGAALSAKNVALASQAKALSGANTFAGISSLGGSIFSNRGEITDVIKRLTA